MAVIYSSVPGTVSTVGTKFAIDTDAQSVCLVGEHDIIVPKDAKLISAIDEVIGSDVKRTGNIKTAVEKTEGRTFVQIRYSWKQILAEGEAAQKVISSPSLSSNLLGELYAKEVGSFNHSTTHGIINISQLVDIHTSKAPPFRE